MNRIILIGNGFDLAHGLKTSYRDFIDWYWNEWLSSLRESEKQKEGDELCRFVLDSCLPWKDFLSRKALTKSSLNGRMFFSELKKDFSFKLESSDLFSEISKSVETKGWVDIENEYYKLLNYSFDRKRYKKPNVKDLNEQINFLQDKLVQYLNSVDIEKKIWKKHISDIIYGPIEYKDISISNIKTLIEHIIRDLTCTDSELKMKIGLYGLSNTDNQNLLEFRQGQSCEESLVRLNLMANKFPREFFLPNEILFLNFNYTNTTQLYLPIPKPGFEINHIHGELTNPDSVIFGYGDELDENYKKLSNLNDNEYLRNFKSIKYLESDRYRKALQFMDAAPYQVFIMGHSCGNSDRTFLNTLFEHKNCVSIKPYYCQNGEKDNYLDIVQNISRNFKDMQLMRDRVVNKTYSEHFSIKVPSIRNQE